ncbi:MAG TPA: helix-turn-helix transcriptional regulator [Candidatus Sulfotelmatobacter sp.]|jgi:transcriptional regulator with XRE-family HTH domain|nr:helix-turn-helix transcriptional regulator [Candidatus Sulfotelmatobacter sp.]
MAVRQFVSSYQLYMFATPQILEKQLMSEHEDTAANLSGRVKASATSRGNDRPVDRHVGRRIRDRRKQLGISRADLARGLGLSVQQVQKYESGDSTVSASRLHQIGVQLAVPPSHFFENMPAEVVSSAPASLVSHLDDSPTPQEIRQMIGIYRNIENAELRHQLYELARTLARASQPQTANDDTPPS